MKIADYMEAVEWLEEAIDPDLLLKCYQQKLTTYQTLLALADDCEDKSIGDGRETQA